jgi:hypothetical protein
MALLRNRQVAVLGPNGAEVSPIYTVQYPDGTKEDVPLKFIHMTDAEFKVFEKNSPQDAKYIRVIDDKDHQEIMDGQNVRKIKEKVGKGEVNKDDTLIQVPSYVKSSDVAKAKPQVQTEPTPIPPTQSKTITPLQSKLQVK